MEEWEEEREYIGTMPYLDDMAQQIKVGDRVTLFSHLGIHYEGKIVLRDGSRWFEVDEGFWIGGKGNMRIIKENGGEDG